MADNVPLNPGVGGAVMRTLQQADGSHVSLGVLSYATALGDGANVVQIVDATHGMPVAVVGAVEAAQADEAALNATVFQGGMWTVALAGGAVVSVSGAVATTQSGAWTVGLAPGTNLAGKVSAGVDGSVVYDGATPLERKFAKIAASASGDNEIVAAVVGKRIQVLRWGFAAHGDVNAKWRSGTTDLTGARPLTKYASAGGAYCPIGLFQTAAGEALNLNLDAAVAVGGDITYVEIPG